METQTDNGDCLYLLTVYGHSVTYVDSVCFFTDYERANSIKTQLQEKVDAYLIEQKEYWKDRCWLNPKYVKDYGNPTVVVVKVPYSELDKVTPGYADIMKNCTNPRPLKELPSSGHGCWFDHLKSAKNKYDEKTGALCETFDAHNADTKTKCTQTRNTTLYVVTDFYIDEDYMNSKIVGVFEDPELAQEAQAKVGKSYGLDVVHSTWGEKNFVELIGLDDKNIDPEEVQFHRMKITI